MRTLRFVGKDPASGDHGCPAVWVEEKERDLVLQGFKVGADTEARCAQESPLPETEAVIRLPRRMIPLLREALDVAELEELRRPFEVR